MKIGFFFNFEKSIGGGHFWRCLNIVKKFKKSKMKYYFFSNITDRYFLNLLKRDNINYIKISGKNNKQVLRKLKKKIKFYKILNFVSDSYKVNYFFEKELKKVVRKLIVIDDYVHRNHFCDLLINNNFLSPHSKAMIKKKNPKINLALGTNYNTFNNNFFFKKNYSTKKNINNIFVFFGSSISAELFKVFKIVKFFPEIKFHMIIGNFNKQFSKFKILERKNINTNVYYKLKNEQVLDLINKCDLAIGAGGVNMLERIYLNLPSLVTCIANNQKSSINYLSKKKLIIYLGPCKKLTSERLKNILIRLINNKKIFESFRKKTLKTCLKLNSNNLLIKKLNSILVR